MAILSKKLNLVSGIWQLIGSNGFVGQKNKSNKYQIVNADSLPTGDIDEAQDLHDTDLLHYPEPLSGNLYVRILTGSGTFNYYEA